MATRSNSRKRRNGLAAFRAVETEVAAALAAGQTVLAIFEEKRARLAMSYSQFARYAQPIRKALREGGAAPRWVAAPTPSAIPGHSPATAHRKTPPKGRPEDAVPTLNMDGFATQVLKNKDLF
jgi:hypothetical protein